MAASVANLISLGIHITQGIDSLAITLQRRDVKLLAIRRQSDALGVNLGVVERAAPGFQYCREPATAIGQSVKSCTKDLD